MTMKMTKNKKNLYRGQIIRYYGNVDTFSKAFGTSAGTVYRVLRGDKELKGKQLKLWDNLLYITKEHEQTDGILGFFKQVFGMTV